MKHFIATLSLFLLTGMAAKVIGQSFEQTINLSARFSDPADKGNTFHLLNIHGSVTVEAYDGENIELVIHEKVEGGDREIKQAKEELEYVVVQKENKIIAYLTAPFIKLNLEGDEISYQMKREQGEYRFIHNIKVRVPAGIGLRVSTINRGNLDISGSFRKVKAANVNGNVSLDHITASRSNISTVNGDISMTYITPPAADSDYSTVNGTIDIQFPHTLSADVYFKSMDGDLYTDFKNIDRLPPKVQKVKRKSSGSISYRVNQFSPVRIGDGGPKLNFNVLNGDVYLRKAD